MKVFSVARPEINNLAKQTGEHANLMIEEHGWGVFLYKTRGENAVQLDTHPGMRVSLHTTAMGKAILAYRPQDEVEDIINQHGLSKVTENTITNRDTLFESLDEIRNRGYAYDDEERVKGMRCIAAPITDNHNQAIAALSVSGPKSRMPDASLNGELADMVQRAANVIQVNLTYS
jgi:DNA-binding IclR family transcriptional regulator